VKWLCQGAVNMKVRMGLLLTCASGALLLGSGLLASTALAAELVTKAPPVAAPAWWYEGYVEVGGRFFLNDPKRDGVIYRDEKSLAKFYEYRDLRPGPFGNVRFSAGTTDGLYEIDFWAKNIGYDNQSYGLDVSKAGVYYATLGWDQTPHKYSTSAQTIYNGVGSNNLTLPANVANQFNTDRNTPANIEADIRNFAHHTDIGIRRDTASVNYRWTPTDAWDIKLAYTHMHRSGTQVDAVPLAPSSNASADATHAQVVPQVPAPVDDVTQNYGISGEYAGTSPWNQMFTFKLGYNGSTYQDRFDSYFVQNPFCDSAGANCPATATVTSAPVGRMSLWPDNQANAFSATVGADLPFKSRYMGTATYTMMRQNESFLPFSNNPASPVLALPAPSLNGEINTTLINNVLTTQLSPQFKSKLSYRYYDFDNRTPLITFINGLIRNDASGNVIDFQGVSSVPVSYTKQDAGAELNWRPNRKWNLGAAYGYEQYDWTYADVDKTRENSGKVFADWQAASWAMVRASYLAGARRYGTYDNQNFFQQYYNTLNTGNLIPNPAYRQYMFANRDRQIAKASVALGMIPGITITPNAGLKYDRYPLSDGLANQGGLRYDDSWNAGVEASYLVNPDLVFQASYLHERYRKWIEQINGSGSGIFDTYIHDDIDTVTLGVVYTAIPNKLELSVKAASSWAKSSYTSPTLPPFNDVKTSFQRIDALAKYKLDPDTVHMFGWKGDVYAKLRYVYERNNVTNWQNDIMDLYMFSSESQTGRMVWMAYDNPNYVAHMLAASLSFKW
jgi:MtrB/PioB family decaheme-associated outer membrane protein